MNESFCDLHLHTFYSDGLDAPAAVVSRAHQKGFAALAITDHDTTDGVAEAQSAARALGLKFLSGVEISASSRDRELHVVGLGIDTGNVALCERLTWLREERTLRAVHILERLQRLGVAPELPDLPNLGRLHIARALHHAGVAGSAQDAFDRFLNPGRPAWVPKATLEMETALSLIHGAGGLALVAHPGLSAYSRSMLPELLRLPFDGIEAYHVSHSARMTSGFLKLARERNLLVSGGSDCHGGAKGQLEMGKVRVPLKCFDALQQALPHPSF